VQIIRREGCVLENGSRKGMFMCEQLKAAPLGVEVAQCCGCGRWFEEESFNFANRYYDLVCDECMEVVAWPNPQKQVLPPVQYR
jgi:recombinational DNA repair protein (RecF pathway)